VSDFQGNHAAQGLPGALEDGQTAAAMAKGDPAAFELGIASSTADLEQILALQRCNVEEGRTPEDVAAQGFVTVRHDLALLREMNDAAGHVVARVDGHVVGYALVMLASFEERIPILAPMVARLRTLEFRGRALCDLRYFIMGQVCVDAAYRGSGAFAGLYDELRRRYASQYDLVVTEVARRNTRSVRAHAKVGFELLQRYRHDGGEEWDLIGWDWR